MGNLKNIDQNTGKKVSIRILVQLYDPALLAKFRSEKLEVFQSEFCWRTSKIKDNIFLLKCVKIEIWGRTNEQRWI